jgi:aryl-alcohol dehydrogenase-like predicted oxidoreductase
MTSASIGPGELPTRRLGGLVSSAQGLGCMGFSEFRGDVGHQESLDTIRRAMDRGITMFDTANIYGFGHNERLLGQAIRSERERVLVTSKLGIIRSERDPAYRRVCGKAGYVRSSCEQSLRRLGVDHIDVYYQHRLDPNTPIEETMLGMAELVKEGKVRYVGLSEASASDIRRAHAVQPVTAVQSEWSLFSRGVETDVVPTCRELGIGLVAFSPLARGLLTDRIRRIDQLALDDGRRGNPRFTAGNFERNIALVAALRSLADARGASVCQLALAWVHHRGSDVVTLPGAERREHVDENVEAVNVQLSVDDLALIEQLCPAQAVAGNRMDAMRARMLQRGWPDESEESCV